MADEEEPGSRTDFTEDAALYKMKIAVALACLRSKPKGMGGQAYASQLCGRFQASQLQWKHKLKKTEMEMLHLRQELALFKHSKLTTHSQNEEDSSFSSSQSLFPTPPLSGNPNLSDCVHLDTKETALSSLTKHTTFLHHVISLQTGSSMITSKHLENLVHHSLLNSLDLLKELHNGQDFCSRLQSQCIESLNKILMKVSGHLRVELINKVCDVVREIANNMGSDKTSTEKQLENQGKLLSQLGTNPVLLGKILELLCESIHRFSESLRETITNKTSIDPVYFSNMYYILDTMDNCLTCQSSSSLENGVKESIVQQLESSAMYLSDTYPIFTLAVWRLCCKIS